MKYDFHGFIHQLKIYSDRDEILTKLSIAEVALKNKEEINRKLVRTLQLSEEQSHEADRKAKEANIKLMTLQSVLKNKEEEIAAVKEKLIKVEDVDDIKQKSEAMQGQLQEKDVQLAILSSEISAKSRLLEDAQMHIQRLHERLLLFEHSQIPVNVNDNMKMNADNNLKMLINAKENELQQARRENHQLANLVFSLEGRLHQTAGSEK